jgi:hypothetical protein
VVDILPSFYRSWSCREGPYPGWQNKQCRRAKKNPPGFAGGPMVKKTVV